MIRLGFWAILGTLTFSSITFAQEFQIFPDEQPVSNKIEDNPNTQAVILDNTDFAFDLFRAMQATHDSNFVFCPYAISSAMGMVFNGVDGITQTQMARGMHFKARLWYLNDAFSWLSERYAYRPQETGSDILLSMSNALWLLRGIPLKPEFQFMVEAFYLSPVRFSNFSLYPDVARSDINSWIRERTKGRISQLFEPKDLPKTTRMLLISATYLRAKWANQFDPRVTRGTPFFAAPGKTVIVPTMVKTSVFSYLDMPEFSMLEIPYSTRRSGEKKLSMLILLPKETFGLQKTLEKFSGESLQTMWNLMTPKRVILSLPKFSLNGTYSMNETLSSLGMSSLFAPGANLSLMTDDISLYLDTLYHRAMVSNDEAGSDAGTPYEVAIPPLSSSALANPALFTVDHPFLVMVVDTDARAVLFMGRVSSP